MKQRLVFRVFPCGSVADWPLSAAIGGEDWKQGRRQKAEGKNRTSRITTHDPGANKSLLRGSSSSAFGAQSIAPVAGTSRVMGKGDYEDLGIALTDNYRVRETPEH